MQSQSKSQWHCLYKWKNNTEIYTETQKTMNNNPEHKEQCWSDHSTLFQIILQSPSNKNNTKVTTVLLVLAQK
jgi:hypothetical protein